MRSFARLFAPPVRRREISYQEMIEIRRRRFRERAAYAFLIVFAVAIWAAIAIVEGPGL